MQQRHEAIDPVALAVLRSTPGTLKRLFAGISPEAATAPADEGWSAQHALAHLVDTETGVLAERVRRLVEEERPFIRSIDAPARLVEGGYASRTVDSLLAELDERRREHVAWLQSLPADALLRAGDHDEAGEITAGDIVHQWAYHDLMHLKQIASILQLAIVGRMGNTRRFYDV